MSHVPSLRLSALFCAVLSILTLATATQAVTVTSLEDDFDGGLDASKWTALNADFEAGTAAFVVSTPGGQLNISATGSTNFWGGGVYNSVDTFASDQPTIITVDRVSQTGSGSAHRSALWIKQTDGTFFMFSQNIGETGWAINQNATGSGSNVPHLDALDNDGGNHKMSLAYVPFGGSNAAVITMFDGFVVGANTLAGNWENNVDFNVRVAGLARAAGDTVSATFDNFSAKTVTNINVPNVTTTDNFGPYVVSDTDLLQTSLTNVRILGTLSGPENTSSNPSTLTDGTFGTAGIAGYPQAVAIGNNTSMIFDLDLAAAPMGYTITDIATYSGWNDAGRDDQDYIVLLSFVDDPDLFIPIANVDTSFGSGGSEVLVSSLEDFIAKGVASVQFAFLGTENGYVGYREFDVIGFATTIPEPTTAMLGMAGLAVFAMRRRRA